MLRKAAVGFSVLLIVLGASSELAYRFLPNIVHDIIANGIKNEIVWRKDAPASTWERYEGDNHPLDPPDYIRFYFLNITNVAEVRNGEKPILQEAGPYTYRKHHQKLNATFDNVQGTVSFQDYFYHIFEPSLSIGDPEEDQIHTLNIPLLGVLESIQYRVPRQATALIQILASYLEGWRDHRIQGLFTTRTASELLWGYNDPLLSRLASVLPKKLGINPTFKLVPNMTSADDLDEKTLNVMYNGAKNLNQIWQFKSYHGLTEVDCWNPPHIEPVVGTDAFQFPPGIGPNDTLTVWIGEAFRSARLIQNFGPGVENTHVNKVPVRRFRPDPAQREIDPRYYQFVAGLMNVSAPMAVQAGLPAQAGPPLFLSLPGYCYADEEVANGVQGIECDHDIHDIYLDVEPTTGITLRALKSVMLSSWFGSRYSRIEPHVKDTFLPIFWAQESSQASDLQLSNFDTLIFAHQAVAAVERWARQAAIGCASVGGVFLILSLVVLKPRNVWQEEDDDVVEGVVGVREEDGGLQQPLLTPPSGNEVRGMEQGGAPT